jgi:hypothetical protein
MADEQKKGVMGRREPSRRGLDDQTLDRELDMALAKYAAVEPRAGLEERILAGLKAEREQGAARAWWSWPKAAALVAAAVVIVAALLMWRSWNPARDTVAQHPSNQVHPNQVQQGPWPQTGSSTGENVRREAAAPVRRKRNHSSHIPVVVATEPRLEQFPSPRPLSDQEKILASYVARYPEHATLIAQARAEALRRDAAEELETGRGGHDDSQQRSK